MRSKIVLFLCFFILPSIAFASDGYIYDIKGAVLINGKLASKHSAVHFGDMVITGSKSRVGIRLDGNVYRMGSKARMSLPEGSKTISLKLFFGSLLAVFRHSSDKTIYTQTAVLGIRGTGAYLRVDHKETYLCTCYGDIDFVDNKNEENAAYIHAEHHNAITFNHQNRAFGINQPMLEHQSEELIELEAQASRTCPVSFTPDNAKNNSVVLDLKP
jgi:hypothetical protein